MSPNTHTYFQLKDSCRKGLLGYLAKAISLIPETSNPCVLDIGCGSGVPTLFIASLFKGQITAVDSDPIALRMLSHKVEEQKLSDRITVSNKSFFDLIENACYDLVFAEGLLNIVGFEKGIKKLMKLAKNEGFLIIHDEFRHHKKKVAFLKKNAFKLLSSFELSGEVWWNNYYQCLEDKIAEIRDSHLLELFKSDILEIQTYKKDPGAFKSVYLIIKKYA